MSAEPINQPCRARALSVNPDCNCRRCRDLRNVRDRLKYAGTLPPPRSDDAWAELQDMLDRWWSQEAIASATGLPVQTVGAYLTTLRLDRPRRHIGDGIAAAILDHGAPVTGWVSGVGVMRRARALARYGHDRASLTAVTGLDAWAVNRALRWDPRVRKGFRPRAQAWVLDVWATAYDRLTAARPGPSWQTAEDAHRRGWAGPSDWHGLDLDDPRVRPAHRPRADQPTQPDKRTKDAERKRHERAAKKAADAAAVPRRGPGRPRKATAPQEAAQRAVSGVVDASAPSGARLQT